MTSSDLQRLEEAADSAFASHQLPHPNGHISTWYLITASEDSQRLLFLSLGDPSDQWRVEYYLDRFKYSLRSCLARVRCESKDWSAMSLPVKAIPMLYLRAQKLLLNGIDYSVVAQICSSAYTTSAQVIERDGVFEVELNKQLIDKRYGALEIMCQSAGEVVISYSVLLWFWIQNPDRAPMVVWQIAESARLSARRIRYEFDADLSLQLAQSMPQSPYLIPSDWTFPWGGRQETTLLINALSVRTLYHSVAVNFAARKFGLKGMAEADLCLCLTEDELIHDMRMNSSLDQEQIKAFVAYLTYGFEVTSPDQALQPLIPLGAKRFGIPVIGWLSSNIERNLLSLQARLESRVFDARSGMFERQMTDSLLPSLTKKWPLVVANRTFALAGVKEEFDVLICEPETATLLVLELRWMLPPADPREVQNKKKACYEKTDQAARKATIVSGNLPTLLRTAFDLRVTSNEAWMVQAIVVIRGFGGALSQRPSVPVIPDWVFEAGVVASDSLRHLAEWSKSLAWLPVEGRDFHVQQCEAFFLTDKVVYPGLKPLRTGRDYLTDATSTLSRSASCAAAH